MYRRVKPLVLLPADFLFNAAATWQMSGRWPVAHLLRHAFDTCRTFEDAADLIARAPIARPALISVVGPLAGQACLVERTETEAHIHAGRCTIANDWHPAGPARAGHWLCRGALIHGLADSERRRGSLEAQPCVAPLDWLQSPVLNGLTRLAVEASPATGELRVIGFEPTSRAMTAVSPATQELSTQISDRGFRAAAASEAA
jgi:hypothetical protein